MRDTKRPVTTRREWAIRAVVALSAGALAFTVVAFLPWLVQMIEGHYAPLALLVAYRCAAAVWAVALSIFVTRRGKYSALALAPFVVVLVVVVLARAATSNDVGAVFHSGSVLAIILLVPIIAVIAAVLAVVTGAIGIGVGACALGLQRFLSSDDRSIAPALIVFVVALSLLVFDVVRIVVALPGERARIARDALPACGDFPFSHRALDVSGVKDARQSVAPEDARDGALDLYVAADGRPIGDVVRDVTQSLAGARCRFLGVDAPDVGVRVQAARTRAIPVHLTGTLEPEADRAAVTKRLRELVLEAFARKPDRDSTIPDAIFRVPVPVFYGEAGVHAVKLECPQEGTVCDEVSIHAVEPGVYPIAGDVTVELAP